MATVFTKIVNGEIPCYKVAETTDFLAFLDINPLVKGHTLVIPKKEVESLFDLEDEQYIGLLLFSKIIAQAIQKSFTCEKVGMSVIGLEVPHAHIHLMPLNSMSDMDFFKSRISGTSEDLEAIASLIRSNLVI
jgi:histidine triad (HIT) family protein